ncbi:hypothetical protein MPSEU_000861400 [Mayamaea pseudoterrestris]|nr:hypothetical protein MPSEU_000861400 [Mayamaea pseudoterrestris]
MATITTPSGPLMRLARNVGGKIKTTLAVVGAAAAAGSYVQYKALFPNLEGDDKKKVLVIPFHRLILKDQIQQDLMGGRLLSIDKDERPIEIETRDLVDLIHNAASDPNIVGLYGIFGHGSLLPMAGWADLEEIREALKVFKEAHRVHLEPNIHFVEDMTVPRNEPKQLVAYADNFNGMMDPGNREYYLASMFTNVCMQEKGEVNLFGMILTQPFLKDALQKYGVKLHVFKRGDYKNAPNMFTETGFNKPHREAMASILGTLQASVCNDITESRATSLYSAWVKKNHKHASNELLWKRILSSGGFAAETALKAGFVDHLTPSDPLLNLLNGKAAEKVSNEETKDALILNGESVARFGAQKAISLTAYKKMIDKKKEAEKKWKNIHSYRGNMLSRVAVKPGTEKIALVYVQGAIGDALARKTVNSLRQIGTDENTKAIVLRVDSPGGSIFACETISQELQKLHLPVVVSFGNVAASGGYYISAKSHRIFASPKTLTGSIGVYGIRADLTNLAKQYGVATDSISTGELAGMFSSMEPMTRKMQNAMEATIDRYYHDFKTVVSSGRNMNMRNVEKVAQGRVWTGEQAKLKGLVDDTGGGLFRALAYAERTFTSGDAEVVAWPKKLSFLERIMELTEDGDPYRLFALIKSCVLLSSSQAPAWRSSNDSLDVAPFVRSILSSHSSGTPPMLSGIYMSSDENVAIQCLMEQNMRPVNQAELNGYFSW